MDTFLDRLDRCAGIECEGRASRALERLAFIFLVLMVVTSPHSIAASQASWLLGSLFTLFRFFASPRPKIKMGPVMIGLLAFFGWSVISSLFSYEPAVSLDKLRGVGLLFVFFFVALNIRKWAAIYFFAFALIASCMVNVIWTPVQRIIGRGVEIHGLRPESPLAKALLWNGDALLDANGQKLVTPDDVLRQIEANEITKIRFYRPDFEFSVDVKRSDLLSGEHSLEKLGIGSWSKSHNWRSQGFFGHYVTYAEVLLLIASLTFGLLIANWRKTNFWRHVRSPVAIALALAFTGMCFALLLTVTRASQLAFLISAVLILVIGASRKMLFIGALVAIPVVIGGLIFLQQSRHTGFFDAKDDSTLYRFTMWQDGTRIATENPKHLIVGVGMDSIKRHWQEWQMFDGGRLPLGHFHSTPLQLLVERGLPALLLWLAVFAIYVRKLMKGIAANRYGDWRAFGVLIGCLGAAAGFFVSGLVHYNLGDGEVALIFYMLMGIGVRAAEMPPTTDPQIESDPIQPPLLAAA